MRRRLLAAAVVIAVLAAAYLLFGREKSTPPPAGPPKATAVIGSGSGAVGVSANGVVLKLPPPDHASLPRLPLSEPPKGGKLKGPMLQQARVLGAAPPALRPYIEGSYYGESGVDVKLKAGVELLFGDASQAARKWRVAAAILASPSTTTLDYVDLHAPGHPAIGGSGHTLPSVP